ncbi:MAG: hypothetical protein IMZ64_05375 [Bacteroidetes bacterium]|nr:hypothetical protein [Bacteroidota bacterium]
MRIFIPISDKINKKNYSVVTSTIVEQAYVDPETTEIFFPLPENSTELKWKPLAKEYCKKFMLDTGEEFTVINDYEFKNLNNNNYNDMKNFLENNKEYGAVSLYAPTAPPPKYSHICAGIIMFRRAALETARFDLWPTHSSCMSVMESLYKNGWKYWYLESIPRCVKL